MKCALSADEADEINDKLQTIREIHAAGLSVIHVIHRYGMDEVNAFEVEAALIDSYPSATNIMGGTGSNDYFRLHFYNNPSAQGFHIKFTINQHIDLIEG